jgi:hypothetical protein
MSGYLLIEQACDVSFERFNWDTAGAVDANRAH